MKNKKQIKMLVKALKSHQEYSKKQSWADSWADSLAENRWRRSVVHEKILDLFDQSMCAYEQAKLLNVTDPKTAESLRVKAAQLQARAITAINKNFTHLARPDVD